MSRTLDVHRDAGEREAALGEEARVAVCSDDLGVNQHVRIAAGWVTRYIVNIDDDEANELADLGCGEAAAVGVIHDVKHVLGKLADGVVNLLDGRAHLGEARVWG